MPSSRAKRTAWGGTSPLMTEAEAVEYLTGERVNMSAGRAKDSIAAMKDADIIAPMPDERMWFDFRAERFVCQYK
jgi:hypothetical protein